MHIWWVPVRSSILSGGSKCTFGVFEVLLRQEVLYFWRVSFGDVLLGCILPARTLHFGLSLTVFLGGSADTPFLGGLSNVDRIWCLRKLLDHVHSTLHSLRRRTARWLGSCWGRPGFGIARRKELRTRDVVFGQVGVNCLPVLHCVSRLD